MDTCHRNRADRCKNLDKYMEIMRECQGMQSEEIDLVVKEINAAADFEALCMSNYGEDGMDIHPGLEIVQVGEIGLLGSYLLGKFHKDSLFKELPGHFVKSSVRYFSTRPAYPSLEDIRNLQVKAVYPVTERGIYASLFKLGKDSGIGMRIDYESVLLKQATVEFCEIFNQDPFELLSCGCVLLLTDHGYEAVRCFKKAGIPAAVIGHMTKDKDKLICHEEYDSNLNRPRPDAYLAVLKSELPGEEECL